MRKIVFVLFLSLLLLTISSYNSHASGIGLMSDSLLVSINFQPNFEETYYYTLLVYNPTPTDVQLYAVDESGDGTYSDIAQYFTLSQQRFTNVNNRLRPYFTVKVKLPSQIKEPGIHKVHVGAVDVPPGASGMGARAAVEAIFSIYVPYNGQYLQYNLQAQNVNQGQPIAAIIDATNFGTDAIRKLYANVSLFDSDRDFITMVQTRTTSLGSQEHVDLYQNISTMNIRPGTYLANATVYYDGKIGHIAVPVKIGELNMSIINQTEEIVTGKINEIDVDVQSEWADTLTGVYAEIGIENQKPIRTLPQDIVGFQEMKLKGFFDATDVSPGIYTMTIKLHFGDKTIIKTTKIRIVKQSFLELPSLSNLSVTATLFMIVMLIIIIINILLFIVLVKKKDEHEKAK